MSILFKFCLFQKNFGKFFLNLLFMSWLILKHCMKYHNTFFLPLRTFWEISRAACLKYLYTCACSMGKEYDKLTICVEWQNFDPVGITLRQWNSLHDWSTSAELLGLFFRKDVAGRWGGRAALYLREQLTCMELFLAMDDEQTESFWVTV